MSKIKWPKNKVHKFNSSVEEQKRIIWNDAIDACIKAHTKWLKENEREMIDMQTGIRHMVIKIKTGESQ